MGAFDGMEPGRSDPKEWSYSDPSSYRQANIDPAVLAEVMGAYGQTGPSGQARHRDGYAVQSSNVYAGGTGESWGMPNVGADKWGDYGPKGLTRQVGDTSYFDRWNEDGTYDTRLNNDSSQKNFNLFLASALGMAGGASAMGGDIGLGAAGGGTTGLTGAGGAGTFTANDIAMMAANGMTDAQIAATVGETAASSYGLAGAGTGIPYANAVTMANAGTPGATTAPATTGPATTGPAGNGMTWQKFASGMKDMGLSVGDIAKFGLAAGLAKDVKPGELDPALKAAIEAQTKISTDAAARAQTNDEYWQSTFAPRYLNAMDQQLADSRRLTDFNMGLAKKYDDRYWATTAKQQDAFYDKVNTYDSEAARARITGEAGANSDMQSAASMQALVRDLNRRGVNPNSGAVLSGQRQHWQQSALQKTMAMNMAREAARKEGLNMRAVAAGLGGNLTGASAGYAGQAGQSSGLGMNGIQGAQSGFNANNQNWNSTMGLGANALSNLGSMGMNLTNQNFQANQMNTQGWNQMVGYGLGMFGSGKGG